MPTLSNDKSEKDLSQEETKNPKQLTTKQTNKSRFVTKEIFFPFLIFKLQKC